MNFLNPLVLSGVNSAETPAEKRSILLSNIISLILFGLGTGLSFAYYFWYGWSEVTAAIPIVTLLTLSPILFNRINLSSTGRVFLCLLVPVCCMSISIYAKQIYYAQQEELDYFAFRFIILASCVFPAIFFSMKEKKLLISMLAAGFGILMLHDPLHDYFGVPYRPHLLKESNYYFTNVIVFVTWSITLGAVLFLKKVSEESERKASCLIDELNEKNRELLEKNTEIEAQNMEIVAQTENLNQSQKKLQEAYWQIADQKDYVVRQNRHLSSELIGINNDLSATNNELIKHNNELRQFSYTVSHNLRGPVATLSGLVNLFDGRNLDQANGEIFSYIRHSIERLETIIKDLSKIIDIRQDIFHIRQKVNLAEEIRYIAEGLQKDLDAHRIILKTDFSECNEIYSVKPMVHSILYNLLTNAIKYRAPERRPEINIVTRNRDNEVLIEVQDNGLGIDLKNQKHNMFKLYRRFHYHTEGKGLGLYLVKLQAEALGGRVDVESELNRFTLFSVTLPKPDNVNQQGLYHGPHARIYYDAGVNAIGVIWNGPVSSEQYRNVFQKCLEFVKAYNTPNYISDLTNQGYIGREDQQWMFRNIMPEAVKYGLKKIAGVRSEIFDSTLQEYYTGISENLKKLGIMQEFFCTYAEATNWLAQQNENSLHEANK